MGEGKTLREEERPDSSLILTRANQEYTGELYVLSHTLCVVSVSVLGVERGKIIVWAGLYQLVLHFGLH